MSGEPIWFDVEKKISDLKGDAAQGPTEESSLLESSFLSPLRWGAYAGAALDRYPSDHEGPRLRWASCTSEDVGNRSGVLKTYNEGTGGER